jgi:hypothetical protein
VYEFEEILLAKIFNRLIKIQRIPQSSQNKPKSRCDRNLLQLKIGVGTGKLKFFGLKIAVGLIACFVYYIIFIIPHLFYSSYFLTINTIEVHYFILSSRYYLSKSLLSRRWNKKSRNNWYLKVYLNWGLLQHDHLWFFLLSINYFKYLEKNHGPS